MMITQEQIIAWDEERHKMESWRDKFYDTDKITGTKQRFKVDFLKAALGQQMAKFHSNLNFMQRQFNEASIHLQDVNRRLRAKKRELMPLERGIQTRTLEIRRERWAWARAWARAWAWARACGGRPHLCAADPEKPLVQALHDAPWTLCCYSCHQSLKCPRPHPTPSPPRFRDAKLRDQRAAAKIQGLVRGRQTRRKIRLGLLPAPEPEVLAQLPVEMDAWASAGNWDYNSPEQQQCVGMSGLASPPLPCCTTSPVSRPLIAAGSTVSSQVSGGMAGGRLGPILRCCICWYNCRRGDLGRRPTSPATVRSSQHLEPWLQWWVQRERPCRERMCACFGLTTDVPADPL
jgi:hypothetical protein